ncbi:MinD/ParA family protein [Paenibacillus albiflavus]|uniref:MinD/ParA family protein n=1 Tax=Paenibacillus albiflavus TaxID=2545760 RepID=A0A4R4EJ64_9BACL|nr:MinD/ParA family protein [Paenibacillus albiflavus]TCZ79979.1 MinD/ParA family protein [Paenibacillus albiflavus]
MNDQAQGLRDLVQGGWDSRTGETKIITISSGKGGVGKSNFALNFGLSLQARGHKVLIFDADIGMANIDVLMGISPQFNLYHLLKKQKTIWEIVQTTQYGISFIAGGSGFNDLISLTEEDLSYFNEQVGELAGHFDYIIFDTGAGLSKETLKFILAANETIIVTTPEPTAITDAYALIKMVHTMGHQVSFRLVINQVTDMKEGKQTANKIQLVAQQFLSLDIAVLGYIESDLNVSKAVKRQIPFHIAYPNSNASKSIRRLADDFLSNEHKALSKVTGSNGVKGFLIRMLRLMNK